METKTVEFKKSKTKLDYVRTMTKEEFIENHGSGTLRKNTKLGIKSNCQYLEEIIAYEFGWGFQSMPSTRVTLGEAISEGDVKGLTELGWFAERYLMTRVFEEDIIEVRFIQYEDSNGKRYEGNGIVIKQTSFNVPKGHLVFAIVTHFNIEKGEWEEAENPF